MKTPTKKKTAKKSIKKTGKRKISSRRSTTKTKPLGSTQSTQKLVDSLIELQKEALAVNKLLKKSRRKGDKETVAILHKLLRETEKDKQTYLKKLKP